MFYDKYVALCAQKGITPSAAAKAIGINKAAVSNWKYRKNGPSDVTMQKIADYFGVPVSELTEETKKAPTDGERDHAIDHVDEELKDYLDELRNRSEMRMLFSVARNANKQKIEAIVKFIEGLEEQK